MASKFVAFPNLYNGVSVINPGVTGCEIFRRVQFRCDYSTVIGDSAPVPNQTNLEDDNYVSHFIAWRNTSVNSYIDFSFTNSEGVTAIVLSFLNSPRNKISLPYIELQNVQYAAAPENDQLSMIPSVLIDNEDLNSNDNQIRTITIQPLLPLSSNTNLRITFDFTEFHDFNTLLLDEVTFCADAQPIFMPNITFTDLQSRILQPTADELSTGYLEMVCIIASDGQYNWQWLKDNTVIASTGEYRITVGDGSRTTILRISNLDFNDAGQYRCTATLSDEISGMSDDTFVIQEIQFPGNSCQLHVHY